MSSIREPGSPPPPFISTESVFSAEAVIQIAPIQKHASSNYHYYSEILLPYGITVDDWHAFTQEFVNANELPDKQVLALKIMSVALFLTLLIPRGPGGFVLSGALAAGLVRGPIYKAMKDRRIRKFVDNGDIPGWLLAWNMEFFCPKGLMIGLNLPDTLLPFATVAPETRKWSKSRGQYKTPKSPRSVARRSRLVVVRVRSPTPEAGCTPDLLPVDVSIVRESKQQASTCVLYYIYGLTADLHPDTDRLKERVALWFMAKVNEAAYRGALELAEAQGPLEQWRQGRVGALKAAAKNRLRPRHVVIDSDTFLISRKARPATSVVERPPGNDVRAAPVIASLDGHGSSPAPNRVRRHRLRRVFSRKQSKDRANLLGGSRMNDASQCFL